MAVCLAGIAVSGLAGMSKERELTAEQKQATIQEFSFVKGILVATFSGVMSASFAYGLAAGKPIAELAKSQSGRARRSGLVAEPARAGRGPLGRLHHQFHLVRDAEHQESQRP